MNPIQIFNQFWFGFGTTFWIRFISVFRIRIFCPAYRNLMFILSHCLTDDGKLDTESDSGEFWVLFGGFAPIGRKVANDDDTIPESTPPKLYRYLYLLH